MCDNQIYIDNIEDRTLHNINYREVVYTVVDNFQLVYHSLVPGEFIHNEKHPDTTQFFRIEYGIGEAIIGEYTDKDGKEHKGCRYEIYDGVGLVVPPDTWHMIRNTSQSKELKFYTIYTKPEHEYDELQESQN